MKWDEEPSPGSGLSATTRSSPWATVNAGAMENKGLNLFNTRYVLARPDNRDRRRFLLAVAGSSRTSIFHNGRETGHLPRRSTFLKEGLTVFREQNWRGPVLACGGAHPRSTAPAHAQFAETPADGDPVRPGSYLEISNFYTTTVYEKGAEVVRMIRTLIGARKLSQGMELYFARHDGQAVTCDDFVRAMADARAPSCRSSCAGTTRRNTRARGEGRVRRERKALRAHGESSPARRRRDRRLSCPFTFRRRGLVGPDGRTCSRGHARVIGAAAGRALGLRKRRCKARCRRSHAAFAPVIVKYD